MNFYKYYIYLILLVFLSFPGFSQDITISGIVEDTVSAPIYFANVVLLKANDSTAVKGTSSNLDGFFELKNVNKNQYLLKISFIGYKEIIKPLMVSEEDINLGTLVLTESNQYLDEINIVVNKPTIKKEAEDRKSTRLNSSHVRISYAVF